MASANPVLIQPSRCGAVTDVLYQGRDPKGVKKYKWVGGHRTKHDAEDALVEAPIDGTRMIVTLPSCPDRRCRTARGP